MCSGACIATVTIIVFLHQFREESFELRTHSEHQNDLDNLDGDDSVMHSRDSGVNHRSVLMDVKYVDILSLIHI